MGSWRRVRQRYRYRVHLWLNPSEGTDLRHPLSGYLHVQHSAAIVSPSESRSVDIIAIRCQDFHLKLLDRRKIRARPPVPVTLSLCCLCRFCSLLAFGVVFVPLDELWMYLFLRRQFSGRFCLSHSLPFQMQQTSLKCSCVKWFCRFSSCAIGKPLPVPVLSWGRFRNWYCASYTELIMVQFWELIVGMRIYEFGGIMAEIPSSLLVGNCC